MPKKSTKRKRQCLCGVSSCDLAWKVNKCCNEETWYFAQDWVVVRTPCKKPKKWFEIAKNVQAIFKDLKKKDVTMSATDLR